MTNSRLSLRLWLSLRLPVPTEQNLVNLQIVNNSEMTMKHMLGDQIFVGFQKATSVVQFLELLLWISTASQYGVSTKSMNALARKIRGTHHQILSHLLHMKYLRFGNESAIQI